MEGSSSEIQKPQTRVSVGTVISGSVGALLALACALLLSKPSGSHFDDLGFIFTFVLLASPVLLIGLIYSFVELLKKKYIALIGIVLSIGCVPAFIGVVQWIASVKKFHTD